MSSAAEPAAAAGASSQGNTSQANASPSNEFSLSEARRIVGEFFTPNPWIYWTDFLLCWTVGVAAFSLVLRPEVLVADPAWHWPVTIACFLISALLYYRCSLFIHELVHIRSGEFTAFRFVWNLLCGIPFLIPSFVYYTHIDHHRRKHYGTEEDGEYIALARMPAWETLVYLSQVLWVPIAVIIRWALLTPLTWVSPAMRRLVHQRASSMIMDPSYIRPLPTQRVRRIMRVQEFCCFAFVWFIALRMFTSFGILATEPLPKMLLVQAYLTAVFIMVINALRTLGAHRWTSSGGEMTFVEQMLDSVDYPKNPIVSTLLAPVGLRFHALHHIFPTMPYHALGEAHRRLMRELPADSPYRQCQADSLTEVLGTLWRRARENSRAMA